jgi:hypothetical protein
MSEFQTRALVTISEEWRLVNLDPPMWRCTLRSGSETVIRTWETGSVPYYLLPMSSPYVTVGHSPTPAVGSVVIRNGRGDAT